MVIKNIFQLASNSIETCDLEVFGFADYEPDVGL